MPDLAGSDLDDRDHPTVDVGSVACHRQRLNVANHLLSGLLCAGDDVNLGHPASVTDDPGSVDGVQPRQRLLELFDVQHGAIPSLLTS